MLARRMLLFLAILLAFTALAAGLAPPPPTGREDADKQPARAIGPPAEVVEHTLDVDAGGAKAKPVVAESGDLVKLTVTGGAEPDNVELVGIGLIKPVDALTPAVFDILADEPGDYAVQLTLAQRRVGTLRITPRKE